jgi:flagellar hook-associated protein 2
MTKQFAGMDAAVAAYKSTQSFLTNQVAAWNSQNN